MTIEIKNKIINRLLFYGEVHEKADSSKVANPAYDEMIVSIIELLYKFNGLQDLFRLLGKTNDDRVKLKIVMFLIQYDKNQALNIIKSLSNSKVETVAISAKNIINEKYDSIQTLSNNYKTVMKKVASKRGLNISDKLD